MRATIPVMLAEPVIHIALIVLAMIAICAVGMAMLFLLVYWANKLMPPRPESGNPPHLTNPGNRRGAKSLWLWLLIAAVLLVGAIFAMSRSKPDVLNPGEFSNLVAAHQIVQATITYNPSSPIYTIAGAYKKRDKAGDEIKAPFAVRMPLSEAMMELLLKTPNIRMREPNTVLLAEPVIHIALIVLAMIAICAVAMGIILLLIHWANKLMPPALRTNAPAPGPTATQRIRKCPKCGADLKLDAPEGLCPTCLLQHGIATEGGAPPETPPFTPPPLAELAKLFPQLEILEPIGQGGMGAVYKARQPALDRFVALKILAPRSGGDLDFAGRFSREARALAKLNHPNIVAVYDFGQIANVPSGSDLSTLAPRPLHYFIMEYVDGANLRQVERAGKLTPREALQIIPQICGALQFAHDEGIVHRDIKPENVLLDKKGRVKIADFGLAKILGQQADVRLTGARDVMGTPHYMAPEQVEKPQEVDHRADIYSLGVVFYEMLTGELPLGKFDPPSHKVQIDVRLDDVVLRSLANNPDRRYQNVGEVKTDIESIAQNPSVRPASAMPFACAGGIDYRSKQTLFGLPLVHITSGTDPLTGKVRVSKGIIAIGGQARGVIAIGGLAMGGLAIGGAAVGFIAMGGCALGILSFGGLAAALLLAFGGGAIAPIAIGGGVIGFMAFGGGGLGAHVLAGNIQDPAAQHFFGGWAHALLDHFQLINAVMIMVALGFGVGLPLWMRRRVQSQDNSRIMERILSWLALMDAGNYGASWEDAALYFRRAVTRDEWVSKAQKIRYPLGAVLSRRLRGASFIAGGTWFEAKYDTNFEGMHGMVETVTFSRQSNGNWQAVGYLIKPSRAAGFRFWLRSAAAAAILFLVALVVAVIVWIKPGTLPPIETKVEATGAPALASTEPQNEALLLAKQPPVVVETFPVSGARDVPSGETEIRVRFSKPMADGSWSWSTAWANSTPESVGAPHYLDDSRTCVMKVRLEAGKTYAWWLNSDKFRHFKDQADRPAVPYLLIFQTKPN